MGDIEFVTEDEVLRLVHEANERLGRRVTKKEAEFLYDELRNMRLERAMVTAWEEEKVTFSVGRKKNGSLELVLYSTMNGEVNAHDSVE